MLDAIERDETAAAGAESSPRGLELPHLRALAELDAVRAEEGQARRAVWHCHSNAWMLLHAEVEWGLLRAAVLHEESVGWEKLKEELNRVLQPGQARALGAAVQGARPEAPTLQAAAAAPAAPAAAAPAAGSAEDAEQLGYIFAIIELSPGTFQIYGPKTMWAETAVIGAGAYGKVYKGFRVKGRAQTEVAIKISHIGADVQSLRNALDRSAPPVGWKHPNVVATFTSAAAHFEGVYRVITVMEFCNEPLPYALHRGAWPSEALKKEAALDIFRGLAYIHAQGFVHCDVAPRNLVCCGTVVKLCDLDTSRKVGECTEVGDLHYLAPETIADHLASPAGDMWAGGVVTHEMLTGRQPALLRGPDHLPPSWVAQARAKLPGEDEQVIWQAAYALCMMSADPAELLPDEGVGEWTATLTCSCWRHTPSERATADDVLAKYGALSEAL